MLVGMTRWIWLIAVWVAVAVAFAVWLGLALRTSGTRDWIRRGLPDRRSASRISNYEEWVRLGRSERRTAAPKQTRAMVAARAEAGDPRPGRRSRSSSHTPMRASP